MIIGICGFIGSGKGTVSDILVNTYGYEKIAFADSLKDSVSAIFGWERHLLEGDTQESRTFREKIDPFWSRKMKRDITPRYILQIMGTEVMRDNFLDSIWVDSLERKIDPFKNYVISDTRFPNEIDCIKRMNGKVFQVQRGRYPEWWDTAFMNNRGENRNSSMEKDYPEVHLSEWAWIGCEIDSIIFNNGTIDDLERSLADTMNLTLRT